MTSQPTIISCYFGKPDSPHIYPAPTFTCYFFTNFAPLCHIAKQAGWIPRFVDTPLSADPLVSAIQSKRIKFLAFLRDKPDLLPPSDYILYVDNKLFVQAAHVQQLVQLHKQQQNETKTAVIIRFHECPEHKTLWDEVHAARAQERYARHMDKTIDTLQLALKSGEYTANTQIYNTGLLFYYRPMLHHIQPLLDQVYDACTQGQQPECQIWWALYAQKYREFCMGVPFSYLHIVWMHPYQYLAMSQYYSK